ncbi:hypothetical protein BDW59DRAFT_17442 [Aspergillus cavernicola]|uniref:CST complex subunit Stn1 N-terminal domain-containing protein n=1 Tax=Aspergillus cavernicola TaxID=176166 RepID=A0ABR4HHH4_9EURO
MNPRTAASTEVQMPSTLPQPPRRPTVRATLQSYQQRVRRKFSKLRFWKPTRSVRDSVSPDHAQSAVVTHRGHRPLPPNVSQGGSRSQNLSINLTTQLASVSQQFADREDPQVSDDSRTLHDGIPPGTPNTKSSIISDSQHGRSELSKCFSYDVVVRRPGDSPANNYRLIASVDTQCKVNLLNYEHWKTLNRDGRVAMRPVEDEAVKPLESSSIRVLGLVRLEWQFSQGSCTYEDVFRIIEMEDYDVLIGSDTVREHQVLQPGTELQRHMRKDAERIERREALKRGRER